NLYYPKTLTYELNLNFRCPPSVVEASATLISNNQNRYHKTLLFHKAHGRPIHFYRYESAALELNDIALQIADLITKKINPAQIAVLSRNNIINQRVAISLRARQIPTIGDNQLNTPHGRRLIALLYVVYKGFQSPHFASVLYWSDLNKELLSTLFPTPMRPEEIGTILYKQYKKSPKHPVSRLLKPLIQPIETAQKLLKQKKQPVALSVVLEKLFQSLNLSDGNNSPFFIAQEQIIALARHNRGSIIPLPTLIAQLELIRLGNPAQQAAVHTLTLHRSKGLEFDYVFIPTVQPGILPAGKGYLFDTNRIEEERRLLYVGMTRTKKQLTLSRHEAPHEHEWNGFLSELPQNEIHPIHHSGRRDQNG
ncbi:MAG: ATP-dependent helicase, partial [Myxococcota bacterium]|nr:ATP-dependent helicase [Myxococcota bacterium]